MSVLTRLAIIFYLSVIWTGGVVCILFVSHQVDLKTVLTLLTSVYYDTQAGMVAGIISGGIILMSAILAKLIYDSRQKERNIAFDNPSGQVSVSLTAIEDLIKRLIVQTPEVKEIRPYIIATKKGLDIDIRLVLRSEVNIPHMTARLQDLVKLKIHDSIGMEGKINVRIHVVKISLEDIKGKRKDMLEPAQTQVPFHGYRS